MSKPAGKHIIVAGNKGQLIAGNGTPLLAVKFQPNSPCRCGSKLKTKRCCGTGDVYRNTKPNKAVDAQLKKEGFTKMKLK
jgi:hypothetical protein